MSTQGTVRLRATWVVEYDADPRHYIKGDRGASDQREMAAMDQDLPPHYLMDHEDTVSFTVEPVS